MIYSLVIYDNDLNVTDVISFSAVTSAKEAYKAQTTDNVVEYGFMISDHIITQSPEITLEVVLSSYSIFSDSLLLEWDGEKFTNANATDGESVEDDHYIMKQKLIDILKKRQLFTLVVSKRDSYLSDFKEKSEDLMASLISKFPNCVITSLDFDSKSNSASAVFASLALKQIRVAVTEQFNVDPSSVKWVQKKTVASTTSMSQAGKDSGGVGSETGEAVQGGDVAPSMKEDAKSSTVSKEIKDTSLTNRAKIVTMASSAAKQLNQVTSEAQSIGVLPSIAGKVKDTASNIKGLLDNIPKK